VFYGVIVASQSLHPHIIGQPGGALQSLLQSNYQGIGGLQLSSTAEDYAVHLCKTLVVAGSISFISMMPKAINDELSVATMML
jgi:hypothetical protein